MKFLNKYLSKRSKSNQNDKNKLIDQNYEVEKEVLIPNYSVKNNY